MLPIITRNICTVFGLGNFTKMPGTLGSIAGAFLGFILLSFFPIQSVIVFFIFLLVLSLFAIKSLEIACLRMWSKKGTRNVTCMIVFCVSKIGVPGSKKREHQKIDRCH